MGVISSDDEVIKAVTAAGGTVVSTDDRLGLVRFRFAVANVTELLRVRDALRAQGINAMVIPALEPGQLGSGGKDDPA